jgi:hypothetical protein
MVAIGQQNTYGHCTLLFSVYRPLLRKKSGRQRSAAGLEIDPIVVENYRLCYIVVLVVGQYYM